MIDLFSFDYGLQRNILLTTPDPVQTGKTFPDQDPTRPKICGSDRSRVLKISSKTHALGTLMWFSRSGLLGLGELYYEVSWYAISDLLLFRQQNCGLFFIVKISF